MSSPRTCQRCGAELSESDARGLCPQCLYQAALETDITAGGADAAGASGEAVTESFVGGVDGPQRSARQETELPEPGERFGHYQLLRKLGRGGMGAVFEADDLESGRRVALKLLAHSLDSREARNRFFREGRLAASINHPNSVYVYGTEEIDGTPAISMEHIAGGTLADRVRDEGPLPPTEAVDAILQVIDGLEAAATAGVLHRDVKPSNCFVDADGVVKVGDFGLSISTDVRGDSHLTMPGSFLGTPAFSSPEQLRGDELDVRSDIYAVGVTLFYLLTGKTPYEADHLVKLLATVLERPAPSPAKFRPEIPSGLARVVLRCLAKQPSDRYRNYAELRAALIPYNSTAPTPATLALRVAAGVCDHIIWSVGVVGLQIAWIRDWTEMTDPDRIKSPSFIVSMVIAIVLHVFYFAVPEGLWGLSLGKAVFRLRVLDRRRSRLGVPRALLRTAIFLVVPNCIIWIYWAWTGSPFRVATRGDFVSYFASMSVAYSYYVMLAVLFSTARRRNGYAGLHDLATGARVIQRPARLTRRTFDVEQPPLPETTDEPSMGPYHVLGPVVEGGSEEFLLGYDTRLLRRVWIRRRPPGAAPVSANQRRLGRIGRLRWIQGRRTETECWDAYEAPSGQPLLHLTRQPQPWATVRFWLLDLAQELKAAERDETLPEVLALDRVWVTAAGRVKLFDFPAPGLAESDAASQSSAVAGAKPAGSASEFLEQVAASALRGRPVAAGEHDFGSAGSRVPVAAFALMRELPEVAPAKAADRLEPLVRRTASVTRLRRLAMLGVAALLPVFVAAMSMLGLTLMAQLGRQHPDLMQLHFCLITLDTMRNHPPANPEQAAENDQQLRALEVYIAGRFRKTVENKPVWNGIYGQTIPPRMRAEAERLVRERAPPSAEELDQARRGIEPVLKNVQEMTRGTSAIPMGAIVAFQLLGGWLAFVAIPGVIAALIVRRGLLARIFGVDYVTRSGARASRPRLLWRSLVCHSPVFLLPVAIALIAPLVRFNALSTPTINATVLVIVSCGAALLIAAAVAPSRRGLADRLAGTYPVMI